MITPVKYTVNITNGDDIVVEFAYIATGVKQSDGLWYPYVARYQDGRFISGSRVEFGFPTETWALGIAKEVAENDARQLRDVAERLKKS